MLEDERGKRILSRARAKHLRVRLEPAPSASVRPGDHRARRHGKFQMLEEHARHVGGGRDGRSRARARLRRRVREEGFDLRATTVRLPKLATQRFGRERHPHSIDARTGTRGISVSSSADTIPGDSDAALARNATSAASATAAASADPAAAACALFVASPPSFHRAASRIAFSSRSPLNVRAMSSVLCHAPLEPHASVGASGRRIHAATRTSTTGAATTPASVPSAAPIARSCGLRSMVTFEDRGGEDRALRLPSEPAPSRIPRGGVPAVDDDGDEKRRQRVRRKRHGDSLGRGRGGTVTAGCRARAGVKRERVFSRGAPVSGERLERVRFANHRRASRARRIERAARRDDVLAVLRLLLLAGFLVDGRESLQLAEFRLALFSRRALCSSQSTFAPRRMAFAARISPPLAPRRDSRSVASFRAGKLTIASGVRYPALYKTLRATRQSWGWT